MSYFRADATTTDPIKESFGGFQDSHEKFREFVRKAKTPDERKQRLAMCRHCRPQFVKKTQTGAKITNYVYRIQCTLCGQSLTENIPKSWVAGMLVEKPFDSMLAGFWGEMMSEVSKEFAAARRKAYDDYLASDAWKEKRLLVFNRSNNQCEKCRKKKAQQVHHLSYEHFGNELLEELLAVCLLCHDELHDGKLLDRYLTTEK